MLERFAARVVEVVAGADGATVTLFDDGVPSTIASTDQSLLVLDKAQYTASDGPCLRAIRTTSVVRTELDHMAGLWPELAAVAAEAGIRTSLSCPLFVPEDSAHGHRRAEERQLSGALNVWSTQRSAFDPVETTLLAMFTPAVSAVILTAAHWSHAQSVAQQLVAALETRDTIATAKGIVMARRGLDHDEAFRWLTEASQHTNRADRPGRPLGVSRLSRRGGNSQWGPSPQGRETALILASA